jgi:hypothetical protein
LVSADMVGLPSHVGVRSLVTEGGDRQVC